MSAAESSPSREHNVAVVGAGATGLAAAFAVVRGGASVRLFERSPRLGGVVASEKTEGWLVEAGPNSFQLNKPELAQLVRELGLSEQLHSANPEAKNRFILRDGKVFPLPLSPKAFFASSLFSSQTKLLAFLDLFRRPRARSTDLSVAKLFEQHFGPEIVQYLADPLVSGIYAGDSRKLSSRRAFPRLWEAEQAHGSLIRSFRALANSARATGETGNGIVSFRDGLQSLTDGLGRSLPPGALEFEAQIESFIPHNGKWKIIWSRSGETHTETFSAVVLAVPAPALARLSFGAFSERPLAMLSEVVHPALSSLFLGFRRDQVAHPLNGFGLLLPRVENRKILGVLFSSSLFPDRAPPGHVALTAMVGGVAQSELALRPLELLTADVLEELKELLGVKGEPVFRRLHTWPQAIPQYDLGHEKHLEIISECEARYPQLFIAGQIRDGVSLANCLSAGLGVGQKALGPFL